MHGSGWFGMNGMGGGWQIPLLVVVLVICAGLFFVRSRSRDPS
jgi:hypothetical protein